MTVFSVTDRGQFRSIDLSTENGQGVQLWIPGSDYRSGGLYRGLTALGDAELVTSFSMEQSENYSVSQCLNGGVYLYTFGHDPASSQFSLSVTSFLSTCDGSVGEGLARAIDAYRSGRVSQSKDLSTLSVGSASMRGYLVGQSVEVTDTAIGIITTDYTFVALSPQGGSAI